MVKDSYARRVLGRVEALEELLDNHGDGLEELKDEVRGIEKALCVPANRGALSTGPFFVRAGAANAVNVKIQNVSRLPVDVVARVFDIGVCPPVEVDSETVISIGRCCTQDVVFTVPAGDFEVVISPRSAGAQIRAFVSVHSGAATTSAFEYVIKAAEMLPVACPSFA